MNHLSHVLHRASRTTSGHMIVITPRTLPYNVVRKDDEVLQCVNVS